MTLETDLNENQIVGESLTALRSQSYEQELFTAILPQLAAQGHPPDEAVKLAQEYAIAGAALYPDEDA